MRYLVLAVGLALVGCVAAAFVFHGGIVDVGHFVIVVPIAAVAIAVVAAFARGFDRPMLRRSTVRRRTSPLFFLVGGVVGAVVFGLLTWLSDADVRAYRDAPSCAAGFAAATYAEGGCRLATMHVVNAYPAARKGRARLILADRSGAIHAVTIARDRRGNVVGAARYHNVDDVAIQKRGETIYLVASDGGEAETDDLPTQRASRWAGLTLASCAFALVGACLLLRPT